MSRCLFQVANDVTLPSQFVQLASSLTFSIPVSQIEVLRIIHCNVMVLILGSTCPLAGCHRGWSKLELDDKIGDRSMHVEMRSRPQPWTSFRQFDDACQDLAVGFTMVAFESGVQRYSLGVIRPRGRRLKHSDGDGPQLQSVINLL
jgi:hypothetical protein